MDKRAIEGFIDVFFTNELILVLLLVLAIVLIILIVYLIKIEKSERSKLLKDNLEIKKINEELELDEESKEDNDIVGLFNSFMPENDEESAITSVDELIKASEELSNTLQMDTSEIIDMYEEEQEKNAIISYEELLKNASSLNIKYEEPKYKDDTEPVIKKIEIDTSENKSLVNKAVESTNRILDYVEEEEFLKVLKRFRVDLET